MGPPLVSGSRRALRPPSLPSFPTPPPGVHAPGSTGASGFVERCPSSGPSFGRGSPRVRPCGRGIDRGRHPEVCRRRAGWQNRQASKGGPWGEGDGWVRRCLTHSRYILKAMLELARRDGVISSNATTGLRKPPDGKKDRALTAEEIAALGARTHCLPRARLWPRLSSSSYLASGTWKGQGRECNRADRPSPPARLAVRLARTFVGRVEPTALHGESSIKYAARTLRLFYATHAIFLLC